MVDPGGSNLPAQRIGAHDLIAVSVYGAPELTRTIRVSAEGLARIPMVKRRIKAEGLLPGDLEREITAALGEEEILVEPVVTVTVVEYASRPISVAGAVRRPLTFQAYGKVTLLEALTRAEGLTPEAGADILVSRGEQVRRIPAKGLLEQADPAFNLALTGGEEVRVPEVGRVFVVGNVKKPGAFRLDDALGITVLKALALAEGLAAYAGKEAYLYRRADDGGRQEIMVPLRRLLDRKTADVAIQPNDIFYIPDSRGRRATWQALERIIGFGTATASGALILGVNR